VLTPRDMQEALLQIRLIPAQTDQLRYPQAVPIGDRNQGGIASAVAPDAASRLHRRLLIRQIFPAPVGGICLPPGNFPVFDDWLPGSLGLGTGVFAHQRLRSFRGCVKRFV